MRENLNDIDTKLAGEGQRFIAKAVASLEDEPMSMVWRSNLNEALREKSVAVKKRKVLFNFFSPVAGLGLACALAVVVMIRPSAGRPTVPSIVSQPVVSQGASLEASLVQLHQDDLRSADVAGTGLNPIEATNGATAPTTSPTNDSEDDFEF